MNETVSAPSDLDEFLTAIRERYDELSDRLQRIARHVLEEPNDMAFETLAVIAERSKVQPSAIVRFAQAFGFSGANPMQRLIREGLLREDRSLGYAERIRQHRYAATGDLEGPRHLLSEFVEGNILALENLNHALGQRELSEAIDLLDRARTVFIAGFRRSFPVASYLAYLLAQTDKRIVLVDGVAGLHLQQTGGLEASDLIVAISFAPYSSETISLVEAAAGSCPIISITDSVIGPIAKNASLVLQVRESEVRGFRSLAASMCLAQSLAIGFAARKAEPTLAAS
ncbi:MurR/RpiR family transcriptional regulator [Sphingobium sp. JS3065]|jgi:DNA-binding MurR/RpiR family transcriptional regulator|uniref:MurR/RpiR family transcriptional regulator n=1 Tax=Sphingobium sp. JS3065 TaxID=2970925 RepID=UPI002263E151|nr:MurR/RpiR family transcriptional regulator [Sphingobium sp. JS3065]UZW54352.1 MurR/RpiR family transcriptional regulator [Sphingobium sp. JS3065]